MVCTLAVALAKLGGCHAATAHTERVAQSSSTISPPSSIMHGPHSVERKAVEMKPSKRYALHALVLSCTTAIHLFPGLVMMRSITSWESLLLFSEETTSTCTF